MPSVPRLLMLFTAAAWMWAGLPFLALAQVPAAHRATRSAIHSRDHLSPKSVGPTNILFITIDTLRADHLGCYGYKRVLTPNIDALAADGTRFAEAYTPVPITLPSHTVMFTGTYPMYSGVHDFSANKLNSQQPTLASVLKDNGFTTGAVVASGVLDSRFGLNRGFDFYYDHFDFSRLQEANLDEMERPGNVVADQALTWLAANHHKQFFFWMHLYDPHYPYRPPPPYAEEYKDHPYDGEIAFADQQVGRVVRYLKEKGLYQHTLIVLSGDHGEGLGEHGEQTHGFFIYRSTLHIPLIVKLAARVAAGSPVSPIAPRPANVVETEVSTVDLMPTLLDAMGISIPAQVQGHSLLSLIVHPASSVTGVKSDDAIAPVSSLYSETFLPRLHFNWSELRGLQAGHYHFIEAPQPELYDVAADPGELHNLFAGKKAVGSELRSQLNSVIRRFTPGQELAEKTGLDPALAERLKSLGYAAFSGGGDASAKASSLPDPKDRIQTYELISSAMADSQHGRYQESAAKLTDAMRTESDSVPVHYLLGLNQYRLHDFAGATESFQHVLKLSPDYSLAVYYLGLAQARAGRNQDAIGTLRHALELDSTNFSAAFNLGAALLQGQQVSEAEAAFRQSIRIYPEYAAGHRALGELLLYQQKLDESLAELRRAVELAPEDSASHASLAKALGAAGKAQEMQQELLRAQQLQPPPQ